MNANILKQELAQFIGTEQYHRYHNLLLTDGVAFLAEKAGAFWLVDVIWSYMMTKQEVREEPFLACKLKVTDSKAYFEITDGDDAVLASQDIEYTDFPLEKFELFVQPYGKNHVVMLPSEY
ncbi:MAG: DUF6876 family protein [bacterium]